MNVDEKDADRGLYEKYNVGRVDGRDGPDDPHHGCAYFVLDLDHDPHALPALVAYAKSAEDAGFDPLAADLREQVWTRAQVTLWRVEYEGDRRPPMWVWASTPDDALSVADISEIEPEKALAVPMEDFENFVQGATGYPILMRMALYSAEEAEGEFGQGFILADGRGRADDGEIRTGGALGE